MFGFSNPAFCSFNTIIKLGFYCSIFRSVMYLSSCGNDIGHHGRALPAELVLDILLL